MTEGRFLRVRNWEARHENNRSRELKRTDWFPFSNELSADSYVELVTHEDGGNHLGVWAAILMVASRANPRGVLVRDDGRPHNAASLARVTRLAEPLIASAIDRLLEIGLLEVVADESQPPAAISHPSAGNPRESARKSREGAVEGKGTEHHHQEGNGKEKKGSERVCDDSAPQSSRAGGSEPDFPKSSDDGEKPGGGLRFARR